MESVAHALAAALSALRNVQLWLLAGIAVSAFAILFAPGMEGIDPTAFR